MQQEPRRVLADTGEANGVKRADGEVESHMSSKIINFNSESQVR